MAERGTEDNALKFPRTVFTRSFWIGDYDYSALCLPTIPCLSKTSRKPMFLGLNDKIPVLVAMVMGLQHALAVAVGTTAFPRIIAGPGPGNLNLIPSDQAFLISTSMIISGTLSLMSIIRIRLAYGYYLGSGLLSLSGTSIVFLGIAQASIRTLTESGFCKAGTPCPDAYAKWLGTVMVGSLVEIAISFLRPRAIRRLFPPIVTGLTIVMLGASILRIGMEFWAGGAGPCLSQRTIEAMGGTPNKNFMLCPSPSAYRAYPWGDPHWIGLGFFVLTVIILAELFGSRFMQGTQAVIGLILGTILSASLGYIRADFIKESPVITFLWVKWFGLGFYAPALVPVIIGHLVSTVETVGDITASCEVSRVSTSGKEFESRVQGGLLADGINSLIAGLMCGSPPTTYSMNNAIIAISQTANRSAGIWACIWLIVMGMFGKIGGLLVSVPDAVVGGMVVYLCGMISVSGIKILSLLKWTRRDRFILSISLAIGLGVTIVPRSFQYFIPRSQSPFLESLRQAALILLQNGFIAGALISLLLNLVVPTESDDEDRDRNSYQEGSDAKSILGEV